MSKRMPEAIKRQIEETEGYDAALAAPPEPAPDDPAPAPAPEPEVAPVAPAEEPWEQRYKSLQGRYNSEVPALRAELDDLRQKLEAATRAPAAPEPAPQAPVRTKLVTEADEETFGKDLVDLVRRIAQEENGPDKDQLMAELRTLKDRLPSIEKDVKSVTEVTAKSEREKYFEELRKLVPDWADINVDDEFKTWLMETDPLSGSVRNDLIQNAFADFDHVRTAAIFTAFKSTKAAPPAALAPQAPTPEPETGLEAEISPGRNRSSTLSTPDDGKKIWTDAEVATFYNDVTRGAYRGMDAERLRIDAEIDRALAEGRVRG